MSVALTLGGWCVAVVALTGWRRHRACARHWRRIAEEQAQVIVAQRALLDAGQEADAAR